MKKNHKGKILNIETIAQDTVKMQFTTELQSILPGQFVSILIPNKTLRRPFSVADFAVRGSEANAHCEQPDEGCELAIIQELKSCALSRPREPLTFQFCFPVETTFRCFE